jgi:hypothetical protein
MVNQIVGAPSPEIWQAVLERVARLVAETPCYSLEFAEDPRVWKTLAGRGLTANPARRGIG